MINNTLMKINSCTKLVGHSFIDNNTVIYLAVGFAIQNFRRGRRGWGDTHNFYNPVKPVFPSTVKPTGLGNTHKTRVFTNLAQMCGTDCLNSVRVQCFVFLWRLGIRDSNLYLSQWRVWHNRRQWNSVLCNCSLLLVFVKLVKALWSNITCRKLSGLLISGYTNIHR